jgi:hypothetical protein
MGSMARMTEGRIERAASVRDAAENFMAAARYDNQRQITTHKSQA